VVLCGPTLLALVKKELRPVPLSDTHLSVVVTVYGETFSVGETVQRLIAGNRGYLKEILLLVSPRSGEESLSMCASLAKEHALVRVLMQEHNPGVGWAYREGMQAATGNYVALMSGDLETEPEAVDRMVRKIEETGCDGVIASRWLPGGGFVRYDRTKLVLNWFFQKAFSVLYMTRLSDITYGFKILSKEVTDAIQWESVLHEIFIETTVKPLKKKFRIEQVPSVWIGRTEGVSKNTFWRNFRYVDLALKVLFFYR
jgi:glycosyltransferase involved in cell wall biosynthesis